MNYLPSWLLVSAMFAWLGLVALTGCNETPSEKERRFQEFVDVYLPNEAANVKDLGNHWYTFDLKIKGRDHTFLYHPQRSVAHISTD